MNQIDYDKEKFDKDEYGDLVPKTKRFIISYRGEFSTVIDAQSPEDAIAIARKDHTYLAWECVGDLWSEYFEDVTDEPYEDSEG